MIRHKRISLGLLASAVIAAWSPAGWAADPFVVKDIRVEGLQRVEPGTVFGYLPVRVGETFTDDKGADAIRALYNTGFFKDVQIRDGLHILGGAVDIARQLELQRDLADPERTRRRHRRQRGDLAELALERRGDECGDRFRIAAG
mgnify:CR=1 FL=1